MRKKIFLVISEEDTIYPECGSPLCRRDRKLRVHKEAGGKKSWFAINRLKCTNEKCQMLSEALELVSHETSWSDKKIYIRRQIGIEKKADCHDEDEQCQQEAI